MEAPICLVENTDDGKFVARPDALKILASLNQPLVVVSMVGKYGTGKSYLLNRIANRSGFAVGSTAQAHTKGIWMWCIPHPHKQHHLLLLDTEGLGNVESDVAELDTWICALAVLFSTVLVYNSVEVIDQSALVKFHNAMKLVTVIKEQMRASGKYEGHSRSVPNFVWVVRDFTLELNINGAAVTSDDYLEHFLRGKDGSNETRAYNVIRDTFRNSFPIRKCFVLDFPSTKRKKGLQDEDLDKEFIAECQKFCNYVYRVNPIKTFSGGNQSSGEIGWVSWAFRNPSGERMREGLNPWALSTLVEECVSLWNSGQISCPNKSVPPWSQDKNLKAAEPARATSSDCQSNRNINKMEGLHHGTGGQYQSTPDRPDKPSRTDLFARNESCNTEEHKRGMEDSLRGRDPNHYEQNEESTERCQNLLKSQFKSVDDKLKAGDYTVSAGHQRYVCDRNEMVERYRSDSLNEIKREESKEWFPREHQSSEQWTGNSYTAKINTPQPCYSKSQNQDSLQGRDPHHYEQNAESTEKCQNLLKSLFKSVDDKLKAGDYAVSGGYQRYVCDRNEMEERYRSDSCKEITANEVLEKYLKEKMSESELVQLMDKIIADKERELTAMKERLAFSEQEKRTLSQKLEEAIRLQNA